MNGLRLFKLHSNEKSSKSKIWKTCLLRDKNENRPKLCFVLCYLLLCGIRNKKFYYYNVPKETSFVADQVTGFPQKTIIFVN